LPTLTVNTRDGYRPGLDDIIAFATTAAGLTLSHSMERSVCSLSGLAAGSATLSAMVKACAASLP